jgi:isopenicillin N synthase-like dioxygenase
MSEEASFRVPVVDVSAYGDPSATEEERRAVARSLDEAARSVGFLQLVGHGVPAATRRRSPSGSA